MATGLFPFMAYSCVMSKHNETLRSRLMEILNAPGYEPLKQHDLAESLGLRPGQQTEIRALLRELEAEGRIENIRKNRWAPVRSDGGTLRGRLRVNLQGHGYVIPEKAAPGTEMFIHRDRIGCALDGDLVLAEKLRGAPPPPRRRDGQAPKNLSTDGAIVRVLERKRSQLVGLLQHSQKYWFVIPDSPRISQNVRVAEFSSAIKTPRAGHKVVVELGPFEHLFSMLSGNVTEDLGEPDAPGVDVVSILRDRNLNESFPDQVQKAAESRPVALGKEDLAGRRDLRSLPTVTIDPVDAKDFDDAVSLLAKPDGTYELFVHIADVAHFVPMGSPVDREALNRGNSVYMVDRHVPMLPKHLTADVCSLRPHSDRLSHTVIAVLDAEGHVLSSETCRSVIHSKLRLNYEQVQTVIDGGSQEAIPLPLRPMLKDMIQMSARLRARRLRNGALDLAMPEVKIELDRTGSPIGIHRRGANEAYHVVEEFMLVANVCVAELLSARGIPTLYRIHELPTDEQWEKMAIDLSSLGIRAHPQSQQDLNEICRSVAGTPQAYPVNLAILKNLKRAMYSSDRDIHFGLAFESYTHFTSPIRRYADLVVHRALCAFETRRTPPYTPDDCARIALHVSDTERNAADAEHESLDVKRIEYYANQLASGEIGPHKALVAGFVSRGLIVETVESLQRGLLSYASMKDDFYEFNAARGCAEGRHSRKRLTLGTELHVILSRVDTVKRLIDFAPAPGSETRRAKGGRGKGGQKEAPPRRPQQQQQQRNSRPPRANKGARRQRTR